VVPSRNAHRRTALSRPENPDLRLDPGLRPTGERGGEAATLLEPDRRWERRAVEIDVPRRAREIVLGFHIRRSGVRIEADDVMLEVLR